MKRGLRNTSLLLLLVSIFGMVFGAAAATSSNSLQWIMASTEEGGEGNEENTNEDNNEGDTEEGEGDSGNENGDEPPPARIDEPPAPAGPIEEVAPPQPPVTEIEEPADCPVGTFLTDIDTCEPLPETPRYVPPPGCEGLDPLDCLGKKIGAPPPECDNLTPLECLEDYLNKPVPPEELPPCDGTPQRCITPEGIICEIGDGSHACECEEDMSDCPNHPSQYSLYNVINNNFYLHNSELAINIRVP